MKKYIEKVIMFRDQNGEYFSTEDKAVRSVLIIRTKEIKNLAEEIIYRLPTGKSFASLKEDFAKLAAIILELEEIVFEESNKERDAEIPF